MTGARPATSRPRALVTGGSGFIGSHLCERLLSEGYRVVCMDNLSTGLPENVAPFLASEADFEYIDHDVSVHIDFPGELDEVYHFASAASPADFGRISIEILRAGNGYPQLPRAGPRQRGLLYARLHFGGLRRPARASAARRIQGNVSTTGVRSVYDEAKRYAEALTMAYCGHHRLETRIARIFNTYGPRMREDDGRMVPNFIRQALLGEPLTVYGEGTQTRSMQYVDDLIEGVIRLMKSEEIRLVNIGNPIEYSVGEVAEMIIELSGSRSEISHQPLPEDDPRQRCPDITRAREVLGWEPQTQVRDGLAKTLTWFSSLAKDQTRPEASSAPRSEGS